MDKHIDRLFFRDYDAAGIPEIAPGGTLVFHGLRHTYCSLLIESGANVKEAQTLLRHMDPKITMNVYSHVGKHRLAATAEAVGARVIFDEKYAAGMQRVAVGAEAVDVKACDAMVLSTEKTEAGDGHRTRDLRLGKQNPRDFAIFAFKRQDASTSVNSRQILRLEEPPKIRLRDRTRQIAP